MRLKDKVVLVTGSTTGIGEAIAKRVLAEGGFAMFQGRNAERGEKVRIETEITNRAGVPISVEIAARTIAYGEGASRLLEIREIGERKIAQKRVSFLAHHDPLTALPNREALHARLAEAVDAWRAVLRLVGPLARFASQNRAMSSRIDSSIRRLSTVPIVFCPSRRFT